MTVRFWMVIALWMTTCAVFSGPAHGQEAICDDGFDNDADTLVDCEDPDCVGDPVCAGSADCNANGIHDLCDLDCGEPGGACDVSGCGQSADCNGNLIPDECDLQGSMVHPDLVHRYSFNGDAGDSVGSADGTLFNGASVNGGELVLAGDDDYVELPIGATIAGMTDATIEAWVTWDGGGTWQRIFDIGTDTANYMFLTPICGGPARFAIRTPSQVEQQLNAGEMLPTGTLVHVAVTIDSQSDTGRLYINAVEADTNEEMTLTPADLGDSTIGYLGKSFWPDPYFAGRIAEFRIYDAALSAAEIADSYAAGPEVAGGLSPYDCNSNGQIDICEVNAGTAADCNGNLLPDECDIASGESADLNGNGMPDECESDCNANGIPDECDLDCGEPGGVCDMTGCGQSEDCNGNGVPDECDLTVIGYGFGETLIENHTPWSDATFEGAPDDVYGGLYNQSVTYDFGGPVVLDGSGSDLTVYEVDWGLQEFNLVDVLVSADGASFVSIKSTEAAAVRIAGDELHGDDAYIRSYDLAGSGLAAVRYVRLQGLSTPELNGFDVDAIGAIHLLVSGTESDCNGNGRPDSCDIADAISADCDGNGVPDECDLADGTHTDCNANAVPDVCDIASGASDDCDLDGVPDDCQLVAARFRPELIHRYSFATDASDSVGGADGVPLNGAFVDNGELILDGTDDYVDLPLSDTMAELSSVTFEAWYVWNGGNWTTLLCSGRNVGNYLMYTPLGGAVPKFAITAAETVGVQWIESSTYYLPGPLRHVAITISSADDVGRIYINGALKGENAELTLIPSDLGTPTVTWLGKAFDPLNPNFGGRITEFRIYDAALTGAEVAESYASGPDFVLDRDRDGNGVLDVCDPDSDGDGVIDGLDACPATVPGAPVDSVGCPPIIPADDNRDGDVDQEDVSAFVACAAGPEMALTPGCEAKDLDGDGDADQTDFAIVQRCYSGEDHPGDPACAD